MSNFNVNGELKSTGGGNTLYPADLIVERGSNYIRYYNGLQICWGTSESTQDNQSLTVSFPAPFVNASYSFTAERYWRSSGTGAQNASIRSKTTSNIVVTTQQGAAGNSAGRFDWVVIGRWK